VSFAPRKRGRPIGSRRVHPDRDKLIHFVVESVISQTGLGVGRGESGPADIDACIITTWILSGGRKCADYVRGLEQGKYLQDFALHLTEILKPHLEKASDCEQLVRQLLGVDHLTVRHAYRRVQAAQPWRVSVREDIRRAERARRILSGEPIQGAPLMAEDDPP
jgi:hypothetical protein